MKKSIFSFALLCLAQFAIGQSAFPSMKGYWYCKSTDEMFVISVDADQTIKGRGVYYSNGNGRFTQMQIMTQTPKPGADGTTVYLLRAYDPAKPKKVFELISHQEDGRVYLEGTVTGARDAVHIWHNIKDLHE
jgi:hypothetical protein